MYFGLREHLSRAVLRRRLAEVYVAGKFSNQHQGPLVIASNHVTYWDGYAAILVGQLLDRQVLLQVSTAVTMSYPGIRTLGLLPVDETNPFDVARHFQIVARRLNTNSGSVLWAFPQGHYPPDLQINGTYRAGIALLGRLLDVGELCVAAMHYEWVRGRKPVLWLGISPSQRFDELLVHGKRGFSGALEATTVRLLEGITDPVARAKRDWIALLSNRSRCIFAGMSFDRADICRQLKSHQKLLAVSAKRRNDPAGSLDRIQVTANGSQDLPMLAAEVAAFFDRKYGMTGPRWEGTNLTSRRDLINLTTG